jgi:hypothetical protein
LEALTLSHASILSFFLVSTRNPGQDGQERGREVNCGMRITTVSTVLPSVHVFKHN